MGVGAETASYSSGSVFFGGEPARPKGETNQGISFGGEPSGPKQK